MWGMEVCDGSRWSREPRFFLARRARPRRPGGGEYAQLEEDEDDLFDEVQAFFQDALETSQNAHYNPFGAPPSEC